MDESINDKRIDELNNLSSKKIASMIKAKKPVDPDVQIWALRNLGTEDMAEIINEYGRDKVNKLIFDTYKLEQRRGING
jgi:hypothetical protein